MEEITRAINFAIYAMIVVLACMVYAFADPDVVRQLGREMLAFVIR